MSEIIDVEALKKRGITASAVDGKIKLTPKDRVTPDILEGCRAHRLEILAELQETRKEVRADVKGGEGVVIVNGVLVCQTCRQADLYSYYPGFPWLCYHCYPDGADGILEWRNDPLTDFVNARAERQTAAVAASAGQAPERCCHVPSSSMRCGSREYVGIASRQLRLTLVCRVQGHHRLNAEGTSTPRILRATLS